MSLETFVDKLVRASDEIESVDVVEFRGYFVSKKPSCSTRGHCPSLDVFGVRPDEVAESTFVRDFLSASDDPNLIKGANFWREAAVDTKDFTVN